MNKDERKEKMAEFDKKMKELNAKIKDLADTVAIIGMEAQDKISAKVVDAKSGLESAKEQYRLASEKGKSKISSELLKAQMNFQVAKENIETKKEEFNKEKLSQYIDNELEYAEQCVILAMLAADEANVAYLQAVEAQKEYDEKYGKEE